MPDTHQQQDRQQQRQPKGESGWHAAPSGADTPNRDRRAGTDSIHQSSGAGVDALRQQADASRETMSRMREVMTESVRRGTQAAVEGQLQFVQQAAEHFQEVSLRMAQAMQGTTEEWRRLVVPPSIARNGLDDLRESALSLFEGIVRANVKASQEIFRLWNPAGLAEVQQRFAHECAEVLLRGGVTVVRAARRTADETLRPLEQRVQQPYQHAAE
jgi:hypothetical protein